MAALPAGVVADRFRRDRVLKLCGLMGVAAAAFTTAALLELRGVTRHSAACLTLGAIFSVWGAFQGAHSTALEVCAHPLQ